MYPSVARFFCLVYPLLVLWGGNDATTSSFSSNACNLPGLCQDILLELTSSVSLTNCILFGRSIPGVSWVTFNSKNKACWALQTCNHLDASVPDRVSSDVNCSLCSVTGVCKGGLLIDYVTNSAENCLGLCGAKNGCAWYSFNAESQICALFQSCPDLLVDGHEDWVSGEEVCSAASTSTAPTPSPSTPPTTSTTPALTISSTLAPAEDQEIVWIDANNGAARLG